MRRLGAYLRLLTHWNQRVNLVSATTLRDPWRRHILDCAQIAPHLPPQASAVADLGSGAGLPGLIVAIMTGMRVHLIESNTRKCAFLREASRITATPVTVECARIEEVTHLEADAVVSRACAPLPKLIEYAYPLLASGGQCLFLKGAGAESELTAARKAWNMDAVMIASRSDADGRIIKISGLSRA